MSCSRVTSCTSGSDVIDEQDGVTNGGDTVYGRAGNDLIFGLGGNDVIKGGGGADAIYGGSGADTLNGGSGVDTANYGESGAAVFVSLYSDDAAYGDAEGDELNSIENVTGSAHDDDLWGNDGANVLRGNDGEDSLKGFGGADTLYGGDNNDSLYGMDGVDTLRGENGNDMLNGGAGDDNMIGGNGDDVYIVDSASDAITELAGQGNDTVYSSAYSFSLTDDASVETLSLDTSSDAGVYAVGNSQTNTIFGNVNDNVLSGGGGADVLSGLGGNDTFVFGIGEAHGDTVYEFNGNGGGAGDVLQFVGYGTIAEGATFHQLTATEWQVTSADGLTSETIILVGAPTVDISDLMFV